MEEFLNENVRICIRSQQILLAAEEGQTHNDPTENDQMETVIFGRHYDRGGKHYLLYDELLEGIDKPIACRIKLSPNVMEMTRQGEVRTTLIFEEGQKHKSNYYTPYGMILLEVKTVDFEVTEKEESLEAEVKYTLSMDGQPVSENELHVGVYHC